MARLRNEVELLRGMHHPHVISFLKEVGRMKFVRPLYRALYAWPAQRDSPVAIVRS